MKIENKVLNNKTDVQNKERSILLTTNQKNAYVERYSRWRTKTDRQIAIHTVKPLVIPESSSLQTFYTLGVIRGFVLLYVYIHYFSKNSERQNTCNQSTNEIFSSKWHLRTSQHRIFHEYRRILWVNVILSNSQAAVTIHGLCPDIYLSIRQIRCQFDSLTYAKSDLWAQMKVLH